MGTHGAYFCEAATKMNISMMAKREERKHYNQPRLNGE
jgi:hypothetical protein